MEHLENKVILSVEEYNKIRDRNTELTEEVAELQAKLKRKQFEEAGYLALYEREGNKLNIVAHKVTDQLIDDCLKKLKEHLKQIYK